MPSPPTPPRPSLPRWTLPLALAIALGVLGSSAWLLRNELAAAYWAHTVTHSDGEALETLLDAGEPAHPDLARSALARQLDSGDPRVRQRAAYALQLGWGPGEELPQDLAPQAWITLRLLEPIARGGALEVPPRLDWPSATDELALPLDAFSSDDLQLIVERLVLEAGEAVDPSLRARAIHGLHATPQPGNWIYGELLVLLDSERDPAVRQLLLRILLGLEGTPPPAALTAEPAFSARLRGHVDAALAAPKHSGPFLACARSRGVDALLPRTRDALIQFFATPATLETLERPPLDLSQVATLEDALVLLAQLPYSPTTIAALRTCLGGPALQAVHDAGLLDGLRALFVDLRDPTWTEGLALVLHEERPPHAPDVESYDFAEQRWCADASNPCPGELPWLALLSFDPERAFDAVRTAPQHQFMGHPEGACRTAPWRPRRRPLLRFLEDTGRRPAVAKACARWLRTWALTNDLGPPVPAINARRFLLARHELAHLAELRVGVSLDVLVAEGGTDAAATLTHFGRASIPLDGPVIAPLKALTTRSRLGAAIARRAAPPGLLARATLLRAQLRGRLDGLSGAELALSCLALLPRPGAEPDAKPSPLPAALRGLTEAPAEEGRIDEAIVLWALARARTAGGLGPDGQDALSRRVPALLESDDWPWHGGPEGQRTALSILRAVSPRAVERGERIVAAGLDPSFEAAPLDLEWAAIDALAAELGAEERLPFRGDEDAEDLESTFAGGSEAMLFAARTFALPSLTPLERRLRCWFLVEHLDGLAPLAPVDVACWLLSLQAVEDALRLDGPALPVASPLPDPPRRRVRLRAASDTIRVLARSNQLWKQLRPHLMQGLGMEGVELVESGDAEVELIVTPVRPAPYLRLQLARGGTTHDVPVSRLETPNDLSRAIGGLIAALPRVFPANR